MRRVSFVIPVHDGAKHLDAVLAGVYAQRAPDTEFEVVAVDDGSTDESPQILARWAAERGLRVISGPGRGAAAAVNAGIRAAKYDLVAQVDHDVVPQEGWLAALLQALEAHPDAAAAQGVYVPAPGDTVWARVMGLDLLQRYAGISGDFSDHVCTGNTAYRRDVLPGLFDESFGYGYDNDMSYRLGTAGHRLVLCREAIAIHRWRPRLRAYLRQQYGVGYGRLDLMAKHPDRVRGDQVSGGGMILHAAGMTLALVALPAFPGLSGAIVTVLVLERSVAGMRAFVRFRDAAALLFPVAHLLRDAAWAAAVLTWTARRLVGRATRPTDSMPA